MSDGLRDTPVGQLLRLLGFKDRFQYPEESSTFRPPILATLSEEPHSLEKAESKLSAIVDAPDQEIVQRLSSKGLTDARIVTWYSDNDEANPRNWSDGKKAWVMIVICLYTFVVYTAASIITPTAETVMQRYNISPDVAYLGLSVYVAGYATGPLWFSPLSEVPAVGRNPPYLYSFGLFFVISIALAVCDNWPAIVVLRFLQGFFGSPALASGAASIEDVYDMYSAPYGYIWWVAAMYCGPAIGPLLPAYAIDTNWRWALWEIVILAAPILLVLPFLPETSRTKIILQRARRLRAVTGNQAYLAPSELKPLHFGRTLVLALIKPLEISVKDPAIGFSCLYCAIVYGIYYSFFEAFPIVYIGIYQMSLGGLGLIFTTMIIGCLVGLIAYSAYLRWHFIPRARHLHTEKGQPVPQEQWLKPGMVGSWGVVVGLFIFAWTSRSNIHWIVPTIGIGIFGATSFPVFQSIICYVALSYPRYVASLFAANDFVRSMTAAALVQCTRYLYMNLGIDKGVTLVAGLSFLGVFGMYFLYYFGAQLRAKSKFTG